MTTRTESEILEVESQRLAAMVRKDVATLERILADDLSYIHSGGRVDTKTTFLRMIESREIDYIDVQFSEAEARVFGDAGLVRGTAQMHLRHPDGHELRYGVFFLDVYTRREGQWQMVAWQATRIPD